jgi:rubrerythrin
MHTVTRPSPSARGPKGIAAAAPVAAIMLVAVLACGALGAPAGRSKPAPEPAQATPAPPDVRDTPANLQLAFAAEVNARERYAAAAKQADREGYPAVAQVFRACARAEQVHADRHVQAIASVGGSARAVLDRPSTGTTAENLKAAIDREIYEATQFYPPLLERARAEGQPMAVRSMTFALSAEREHVRLLTAALETLGSPAPARTAYVCPFCGKTTETLDFRKCPNCFTAAGKFFRVAGAIGPGVGNGRAAPSSDKQSGWRGPNAPPRAPARV